MKTRKTKPAKSSKPAKAAKPVKFNPVKYVNHLLSEGRSISITFKDRNGVSKTAVFQANSDEYVEALELLSQKKKDELPMVIFANRLWMSSKGEASVSDEGNVVTGGDTLPPAISARYKQFVKSGADVAPLMLFWQKLKKNPSDNSKAQLFKFIEKHGVTILDTGDFLLYKSVQDNLCSHHDRNFQHSVGEFSAMSRKLCDDNPRSDCSTGLHVAPYKYVVGIYGGKDSKWLELVIDPVDVVSVPHDANGQKMRVCRYFVNGVVNKNGVGIRTGLIASSHEKPTSREDDHGKATKKAPAKPVGKSKAKSATKRHTAVEKSKNRHEKRKTKALKIKAPVKVKKIKVSLPAPLLVELPSSDRMTIVGKFLSAAGFSPRQDVSVCRSKTGRGVFVFPKETATRLGKRYEAEEIEGGDVTLSDATSLRLKIVLLREAGVRKAKLTVKCPEVNVISIS